MGKTAPGAALRARAREKGATALTSGAAAVTSLTSSGAAAKSAFSGGISKVRQSPRRKAKATASLAKGVVSSAHDHVKGLRRGGKTMADLAALAHGELRWDAEVLQACLQAFGGNLADAAEHMERQIALLERGSAPAGCALETTAVQATFTGGGDLGLQLAPAATGGAVVVHVEPGGAAYAKPQLTPGLTLTAVQGHTVQSVPFTQVAGLLRTAGRPLQLRFQSTRHPEEPVLPWYRALSRARIYSAEQMNSAACGFLEVGEMVQCVEEPGAADPEAGARVRVHVRRQRGPPIGWVALINTNGKTVLQDVTGNLPSTRLALRCEPKHLNASALCTQHPLDPWSRLCR